MNETPTEQIDVVLATEMIRLVMAKSKDERTMDHQIDMVDMVGL